jgi:hypothetical protein
MLQSGMVGPSTTDLTHDAEAAGHACCYSHHTCTINFFATSASFSGSSFSATAVSAILGATSLIPRKFMAIEAEIAKFTFRGTCPVMFTILIESRLEIATPVTRPLASITGPPLLPGWIGADIWKWRESLRPALSRQARPACEAR